MPRAAADARLPQTIPPIPIKSRRTSGAPRGPAELRADHEIHGGRKRVARLMRRAGLVGCHRRRPLRPTKREPPAASAPDRGNRVFAAPAPHRLWGAAITSLPLARGFAFLAVVRDVFSRKVVGWALAAHLRTDLGIAALELALGRRQPADGLVQQSAHGGQDTSLAFGQRCQEAGSVPSLGAIGACSDTALAARFFAPLETELLATCQGRALAEARTALFAFIYMFSPTQRRHSARGSLCPGNDEKEYNRRRRAS